MQRPCLHSLKRVGARGVAVAAAAGKARGRKMARNKSTARSNAEAEARPAIVAFDLDGTLWYPEMYILDGAPTKKSGHNTVLTTGRDEVELIRDSHKILKELATQPEWQNTHVAYVSRTTETSWAKKCLKLLESQDGLTLDQQGRLQEIYPGNKRTHFTRLHEQTSIPFSQMLFFDNEHRNVRDVAQLGVVSVYTPDGMTDQKWRAGLQAYAKQNA